ncbi:hypothetical protein MUY27_01085 [Mucilaginibacter sp. RS28]|uniref:Uncharacterized protein n=1 Tax=Mucilaginibacter straminoryzae TaxID=2932774 RepID=A0A9X1X0B3_9SPHI|nr:hypothetical protein [Mucilaginibacter straminoryzae]MCJ8208281.1 hypothetical protein [Mucilaginibacter straminoryzae]
MRTVTVEVWGTNISSARQAGTVIALLRSEFPECRISIDLEDCDKVLRIEGCDVAPAIVVNLVTGLGFLCRDLV